MNVLNRILLQIVLIGAGAFLHTTGFSQNFIDLLRIEFASSPGNAFKSGTGSSDIQEWTADVTVPIVFSAKNTLLTGFLYEHIDASLYAHQQKVSVSTLNLKLGLNQTYSETWSASYILLPKFSSDLKQYNAADFQFGVAALFKRVKSQNLNFKFGVFFNTDRFGPFVTPLLGFYYQKEKWEANILLPRTVDINYRAARSLRLGLRFNGSIRSFNLNLPFNNTEQYLAISNTEISTYLGWSFGRINCVGSIGYSIGRNYRTYARDDRIDLSISLIKLGDERQQLNSDIQDGLVFKLAAMYRLPILKEVR